jgi:hypothetical protein
LVAILRGNRLNSRIAFQATAEGGERFALVLDFNLLPRLAPPKKSKGKSGLNSPPKHPSGRQAIRSNTTTLL